MRAEPGPWTIDDQGIRSRWWPEPDGTQAARVMRGGWRAWMFSLDSTVPDASGQETGDEGEAAANAALAAFPPVDIVGEIHNGSYVAAEVEVDGRTVVVIGDDAAQMERRIRECHGCEDEP